MAQLSPHAEMLLQEFKALEPKLQRLERLVNTQLNMVLREQGLDLAAIESRVKTERSFEGKLERKGDKYRSLGDITDLVGARIVTFYTDDVDKVAAIVKKLYDVDWKDSVDKRKVHSLTSFGYLSLHYICRLKTTDSQLSTANSPQSTVPSDLCGIPFEVQMRTALQHVWSAIEHDIGYKGAVKLPPEYRRQFSRLAGMLELADDEFSRLRTTMTEYRRKVETLVKSGRLDEVPLSTDSFRSFLSLKPFERLNKRIAAVNQAEVFPASLLGFLPIMEYFQLETLGDVQRLIDEDSDDAYQLALSQLAVTDLDIFSESIGLQNLCIVHALKTGSGRVGLQFIYDTLYGKQESNSVLVDTMMELTNSLPFMHK